MELNKSQLQAVCHDKGPMMVLAGPGSGKTMVITHRVKWLIEHAGVHPAGILVVTFTKAAADEMRQRFVSLMDGRTMPVSFGTFHAIFFSVLKHAYNYTASNIIREEQKQQLIREIIEDMPVEPDNVSEFVNDVLSEIGLVKGSMMDIEHYYATSCATSVFRDIYKQYVQRMENSRLIDFEDMLVYTWELFTQRKDILAAWQHKFQYILIDEFQDINLLQYKLIRMLALPQNNIFIVGDDDQYQQKQRQPHQQPSRAAPALVVDLADHEHGHQADGREDGLPLEVVGAVPGVVIGPGKAGGKQHDQADDRQQQRQDQEGEIHLPAGGFLMPALHLAHPFLLRLARLLFRSGHGIPPFLRVPEKC